MDLAKMRARVNNIYPDGFVHMLAKEADHLLKIAEDAEHIPNSLGELERRWSMISGFLGVDTALATLLRRDARWLLAIAEATVRRQVEIDLLCPPCYYGHDEPCICLESERRRRAAEEELESLVRGIV